VHLNRKQVRSQGEKNTIQAIRERTNKCSLRNLFPVGPTDLYNREKKIEEYKKLYELASSHLARRTFVDILCQAGEPIHVVASMSGHSENSKAFDRYRRRPEQLQINAVNRSMD